ncbi:MAG: hypothetical protein LBT09_16070 [Planctomycetaceae bacterium]|nr:hypothetical protein [Planctomycetaceae bacterium]
MPIRGERGTPFVCALGKLERTTAVDRNRRSIPKLQMKIHFCNTALSHKFCLRRNVYQLEIIPAILD